MTPESVHYGFAPQLRAARREVLLAAYARHPERFARAPEPPTLPEAVWINPPQKETALKDAPGSPQTDEAYPEVSPNFGAPKAPLILPPPVTTTAEAH